jgi:VIT1/CCC1 family predicted Fe2+/Mn2+ transporter
MNPALLTGLTFGSTSGIITTLGLMVGLQAGTHSRLAVVGGILTIAIADAFSDALGIHFSEEAEGEHTTREVWAATIFTFLAKFVFACSFLVPLILFELSFAVIISIIYGLMLLALFSFIMAKNQKVSPLNVISEHVFIALVVVVLTHYVGKWIQGYFS